MTLTSTTNKVQYSGDGSTVSFAVNFVFWDADDLRVILTTGGVEEVWVRGTQYTVSGGDGSTGTVTVSTSPTDYTPASGTTLTIKSNLSDVQNTFLPLGGEFPSASVEEQFDKIVRLVQQKDEELDRSLKFAESSATTGKTVPEPSDGKVLGWDSTTLANLTPNTDTYFNVSSFMETVLDDTTAANARTTLGALTSTLARGSAFAGNSSDAAAAVDISTSGNALVGDGTDAVATGIIKQGTHTIWIPAVAFKPTVTNGCATVASTETTSGRPDIVALAFDASTQENAQAQIAMPPSWDEGTVTARFRWTSTATDADGVTWGIQGVSVSDGDSIDVAYGTAVIATDLNQSTAEDQYTSPTTSAMTFAGSPASGDLSYIRVYRDVADANDTASEDALLLGVELFITINAADDS